MAFDLGYDESGASDILLVTVQIGKVKRAKQHKNDWREILKPTGVEYFHAKEFDNYSHGIFAGLDREKRLGLLHSLACLSREHLFGMTAKITKSLYDQKTTPLFRSKWGTAYTFSIQMLIVAAYLYADTMKLPPEFNVLIEDGHRHAAQAIESLHQAKSAGMAFAVPSKLLNIGLGSKRDHPILQAADMLAYGEWQKMSNGDLTIYEATHRANSIYYEPEMIDFDLQLVDVVTQGAEAWMAKRKMFGERRAREIEQQRISEIRPDNAGANLGST